LWTDIPCPTRPGWNYRPREAAKKLARQIAHIISVDNDDPGLTDVVVKSGDGEEIY